MSDLVMLTLLDVTNSRDMYIKYTLIARERLERKKYVLHIFFMVFM